MQNNVKVALIQHRTGTLDAIPEKLNQSELGFAYDANRLFIGNPDNTLLENRKEFPYQNVEILTEFSDLMDHIVYKYSNNIMSSAETDDREILIEQLPIAVLCQNDYSAPELDVMVTINGETFTVEASEDIKSVVNKINDISDKTKTTVSIADGSRLLFITNAPEFIIDGTSDLKAIFGFPKTFPTESEYLPEHHIDDKLDDNLHITDFGVQANSNTDVGGIVRKAIIGVYGRVNDPAMKRRIFFPAGEYLFDKDENSIVSPLPLKSGTYIAGEGIDRTILRTGENFSKFFIQTMDEKNRYADDEFYTSSDFAVENVVIKDLTIDTPYGIGSVLLRNAKHITFDNVKINCRSDAVWFYGDTDANDESGVNGKCQDIIFHNCIFAGGTNQLYLEKNIENAIIINCIFDGAIEKSIKIGDSDTFANINKVQIRNNTFRNINESGDTSLPISVLGKSTYVSVTGNNFDERDRLYEEGHQPINDDFNISGKNYTDILFPRTDTRKFLNFRFTQPEWCYINQLIADDGKLLLNTRHNTEIKDTERELFVDLNVVESEEGNSISLTTQGTLESAELNITNDKGNINIAANGEINALAPIDLNDNHINNKNGTADITLELNHDQIAVIEDVEPTEPYNVRASRNPNALVIVSMVRNLINTYHSFSGKDNIDEFGNLQMFDVYSNISNEPVLKNITTSFLNSYFMPCADDSNIGYYSSQVNYKADDIIKIDNKNYIATEDFTPKFTYDDYKSSTFYMNKEPLYDTNFNPIENFESLYSNPIMDGERIIGYYIHTADGSHIMEHNSKRDVESYWSYCYMENDEIKEEYFIKDPDDKNISELDLPKCNYVACHFNAVHYEPLMEIGTTPNIKYFDILLHTDNKNYVFGRKTSLAKAQPLCNPNTYDSENYEGVETVDMNKQYHQGDIFLLKNYLVKCVQDEVWTHTQNLYCYKIEFVGNGDYIIVYSTELATEVDKISDLYDNQMRSIYDDPESTFVAKHADDTDMTNEERATFIETLSEKDIIDVLNNLTVEYASSREHNKDTSVELSNFANDDEKYSRFLDTNYFERSALQGNSYELVGSLGIFETDSEISTNIKSVINLEDITVNGGYFALRLFDENDEHVEMKTEKTDKYYKTYNDDIRMGFTVEVSR